MPATKIDPDRLRRMIEVEQLQQRICAQRLGVSLSCVERTCARLGLKTQRTGPRAGPGHPNWAGGRVLMKGYWHLWMPDHPNSRGTGYVAEHRKVMADKIGRRLRQTEVVHHIDGDPLNNDPSNLMLFQTNVAHLKHELTGRKPNWSEDGKRRIREGIQRSAIHRASKRGGSKRTRTSDRSPS